MNRSKPTKRSTLFWVGASVGLHLVILLLLQFPAPPRKTSIDRIEVGLLPQPARIAAAEGEPERQPLPTEPVRRPRKKLRPAAEVVPAAAAATRKASEVAPVAPPEPPPVLSPPEPPTTVLPAPRSVSSPIDRPTSVPEAESGRVTDRTAGPGGKGASTQKEPREASTSPSSVTSSLPPGEGPSDSALVKATPLYAHNPPPPYPPLAQQRGWEGEVLLRVVVGKDGLVRQVVPDRTSGHSLLDAAALKAVRRWRFQPARRGGRPVVDEVRVPIRFKLEKRQRSLFGRF